MLQNYGNFHGGDIGNFPTVNGHFWGKTKAGRCPQNREPANVNA